MFTVLTKNDSFKYGRRRLRRLRSYLLIRSKICAKIYLNFEGNKNMSLQLVYGRSGSGKSQYLLDNIKERINGDKKIYIIVPEQFSFSMEKRLLETIGTNSVINAEVLTLSRMATRVINKIEGNSQTKLSKIGRAMVVYSVLNSLSSKLNFLNDSNKNLELVLNAITELKKHSITDLQIEEAIEKLEDEYLKLKLSDLKMILHSYNEKIKSSFIDESDTLDILIEKLEESKLFNDTVIYVDEFMGFTVQEYNIIEKLMKVADSVTVTVCADALEYDLVDMSDIFYFNKQTANRLLAIARNNNIDIAESVFLSKNRRIDSPELSFLETYLYSNKNYIYDKECRDINIFMAKNPYSEVEYVAEKILELVREENARFNDIGIITKNIDEYSFNTKAIFDKYKIPIFIDEKKDVNNNILMIYLISLFNIINKNWSYDSVFSFLKTGLTDLEDEEIYNMENYAIKWGIKGSRWQKADFEFEEKNDRQDKINKSREKFVRLVSEFKDALYNSKNVKDTSEALVDFINSNNVSFKIYEKAKALENRGLFELASEYRNSLKLFYNVLDEMVLIYENEDMNPDKFSNILQIGLSKSEFGAIPSTIDQVVMGDIERTRIDDVKYLFILGMNDGVIPSIIKSEGFLNDKDREFLKISGLDVAKGTVEQLYENQFNLYKIFTSMKEKLFLSYPVADKDGKNLRHSVLITKIKNMFKYLNIKSDVVEREYKINLKDSTFDSAIIKYKEYLDTGKIEDKWLDVLNWYYINENEKLNKVLKALDYSNVSSNISRRNIERLYGNTMKTSISRLEQYRRCPFSFHLKYGLKVDEKEEFNIRTIDTGSFMHDVIDTFFEYIQKGKVDIYAENNEDSLREAVYSIIDEKLKMSRNYIFTSTPKYIVLTERLSKVVYESITYIVDQLRNSKFKILEHEVEFNDGKEYKPIIVKLDDGRKVELTGKIDRVDTAKIGDNEYVRIIDYKSSVRDVDLNQVISGLQIQLISYLDAIVESKNLEPSGILYFGLIEDMLKSDKNLSSEEIKNKIRNMYRMKGLILADIDVIHAMDTKLETGQSDSIPAYIDKEGNISSKKSSVISKEKFESLQRYSKKIIKEISSEIMDGNISIKPYYLNKRTGCDYCPYKSVCDFDVNNKDNNYKYIKTYDKEYILDMLENNNY